jgi:hypothetical protein
LCVFTGSFSAGGRSPLELCIVEKPDRKLDGHSALPVIEDVKAESAHKVLHYMWQEGWCVREGDSKLIGSNKPRKNGTLPLSLHNLAEESPEVRDRAAEKPDLVKRLKQLHDNLEQDVFSKSDGPKVQRDPKRQLDL